MRAEGTVIVIVFGRAVPIDDRARRRPAQVHTRCGSVTGRKRGQSAATSVQQRGALRWFYRVAGSRATSAHTSVARMALAWSSHACPPWGATSCAASMCARGSRGQLHRRVLRALAGGGTPFVAGESWRVSAGSDDESAGQESPLADGATQADNVPKHGLIRISGSIGTWLLLTGVEKRIGRGAAKAWDILAIWRWEAVMRGWCLM